jgi:hypothetical protein
MELFTFKKENPKFGVQIDSFISSLGAFFKKYIERGLERIETEQSANNVTSSPAADLETYRHKLISLKSQMFGSSESQESSTTKKEAPTRSQQLFESENASMNASPLRSRLESPAAKFARFGCSTKTLSSSVVTEDLPPKNDAVISNLKERLARLKQQ